MMKGGYKSILSELLTVREVARILRVDDTTVRRWVKDGALEAVILPHTGERQAYRIRKSTLDNLLKEQRMDSARMSH
jgi:excisionase family DNA binding protein